MTSNEFDTICLSGGGIKGFSFIGALDYLQSIDYINLAKIKNWVGTSAGAMLCTLFSVGYSVTEIKDFILYFNFRKLSQDIDIDNLLDNMGLDSGDKLTYIMSTLIRNKTMNPNITFIEHHKLTKSCLTIIGTNFSKGEEAVFNYVKTPNMPVITAIRISSSVPILFTPVLYESDYYVDGALVNNFPINYCNQKTTLGIYVKNSTNNKATDVISIIKGCLAIVSDTISNKDNKLNSMNIIQIDNNIHEFTNFDMDLEKKQNIINLGYTTAQNYTKNIPEKICSSIVSECIDNALNC